MMADNFPSTSGPIDPAVARSMKPVVRNQAQESFNGPYHTTLQQTLLIGSPSGNDWDTEAQHARTDSSDNESPPTNWQERFPILVVSTIGSYVALFCFPRALMNARTDPLGFSWLAIFSVVIALG